MRQERTVQATIFEVFARHEIGCELKVISQWLAGQRALVSLGAGGLRGQGGRARRRTAGGGGSARPSGARHRTARIVGGECGALRAAQAAAAAELRGAGLSP